MGARVSTTGNCLCYCDTALRDELNRFLLVILLKSPFPTHPTLRFPSVHLNMMSLEPAAGQNDLRVARVHPAPQFDSLAVSSGVRPEQPSETNMTARPLDANVDGIAIIDGLEPSERHTYRDTAKLTKVIRNVSASYLGPVKMCDSKYAYFDAIDYLISEAQKGRQYVVHIECHGSPDGLQMGTDDVTWEEQLPRLVALNEAMNHELVIDLSACNGIYASKMAGLQTDPPPFYGIIGPAKEVNRPARWSTA